jgi:hypothetical protein
MRAPTPCANVSKILPFDVVILSKEVLLCVKKVCYRLENESGPSNLKFLYASKHYGVCPVAAKYRR